MKYKKKQLNEIVFPLGGIGTGSIGLSGNGQLIDWEIFNIPNKGSYNDFTHIALKAKWGKEKSVRVLQGDLNSNLMGHFNYPDGYGHGAKGTTMCGLPHFKNCEFVGEFPFATIRFSDENFPGKVELTAFNPFIPLDDVNSSIPAAFFEIKFINNTENEITYTSAFSLRNFAKQSKNIAGVQDGISYVKLMDVGNKEKSVNYSEMSLATDCDNTTIQKYWYRNDLDSAIKFWNEFSENCPKKVRDYSDAGENDICTVEGEITLKQGEEKVIRYVLSWNIPYAYDNYIYTWYPPKEDEKFELRKNFYATIFKDSVESSVYSLKNWNMLYTRTMLFKNTLYSSTIDKSIIDAISANISVLKTPTILRFEDGSIWGFEGVLLDKGVCHGTCQHVYNYAYALCFLFPKLERSIRNMEFEYATYDNGDMQFRIDVPLQKKKYEDKWFTACADGQFGTVIKSYREWKLSGDDEWLKKYWNTIQKILEFTWSDENPDEWDRNKTGVIGGRQHHTLDVELFGPNAWIEGLYLAALKAAAEMAEYLGYNEKAKEYKEIFEKGYKWTKENLFNGEYFIHKIDINDKSLVERYKDSKVLFKNKEYWDEETNEIKYQIGDGCVIDQLLGQWHSHICGLGEIFDKEQRKTAIESLYKYNFKKNLREFANTFRVFALNDEAGAIICDYPEGRKKPCIPLLRCDEIMYGFSYALAGEFAAEGEIEKCIELVKATRACFDGEKRNPWNEPECGSNYIRSMASYAILPILSGFIFDIPNNKIGFNPKVNCDNFKALWSVEGAWGQVIINKKKITIKIFEGSIELKELEFPFINEFIQLKLDNKKVSAEFNNITISFNKTNITKTIEVIYK